MVWPWIPERRMAKACTMHDLANAPSGGAGLAREMPAPGVGEPRRYAGQAAGPQEPPDPQHGELGLLVDAAGGDDQDPPTVVVDALATREVGLPLLLALDVVPTVVLGDHLDRRPAQVVAPTPTGRPGAERRVDVGLGEAGQDQQHPQPVLHRRLDALAHEAR